LESLEKKEDLSEKDSVEKSASDVIMIDTQAQAPDEKFANIPLPYMIVKAVGCNETSLAVESNGLHLSASKLACKFVKSKPSGASNDGASVHFLAKHASNRNQVDDNEDASSNKANAGYGEVGGTEVASGSTKKYSEPDQITDLAIDLDDPAVQHALTLMVADDMFSWVFEMSEDGKNPR